MLNRAALIIRYKQPFVDWINSVDSEPENTITLTEANQENTVYLVEAEDTEELDDWLDLNYEAVFEDELNGWYTDPALWPDDRSLEFFKTWCGFELHTVIFDAGSSPLEDDET